MAGVMYGRDVDLECLCRLIEEARQGRGGALLVHGEAGVGKSMLLAAGRAHASGFQVLSAGGVQSESSIPYSGLFTLLARLRSGIDGLPARQRRALLGALGQVDGAVDTLACCGSVLTVLARAAESRPVLVIVDDLQWLDAESRQAVLFCARRMGSDPIVFWFGMRDPDTLPLPGDVPALHLEGLDRDAARELLIASGVTTSVQLADRLWRATGGNPLALTDINGLDERDVDDDGMRSVPLSISERLESAFWRQVGGLPDPTRRALVVTACSYTSRVDAIACALGTFQLSLQELAPAEDGGLVSIADGVVTWRHPLVRSAVYQRAPAAARREAHLALAQCAGDADLADHRAWHLASATTGTNEAVAALLSDVGDEADRRGAWTTAKLASSKAAELSPGAADRARRELRAAEYAARLGLWDGAMELVDAALSRSDDLRLQGEGERIRNRVAGICGMPEVWHDRLVSAAERLVDLDRGLAALLMTQAAVPHIATGDHVSYTRTSMRALALAQPVGGLIEGVAATLVGSGQLISGQGADARASLQRATAVVGDPVLWHLAPEIVGMCAFCDNVMERFSAAEQLLSSVVESTQRSGAVRTLYYPLAQRAILRFRCGRWPAALADAQQAVELGDELPDGAMQAFTWAVLAVVESGMGHADHAQELAERSSHALWTLGSFAVLPWVAWAQANLALSRNEPRAAVEALDAIPANFTRWTREPGWFATDAMLIEAKARAGDRADAEDALERLERDAVASCGTWSAAVASRCRGLLEDDGELDRHFAAALRLHARTTMPFEHARTQLCYGERLRRARRRADARRQLSRAAATFGWLGAELWAQRAEEELAAAGSRQPARSPRSPWASLTTAEVRVAHKIIEGATNSEAASALFLSPRTVEAHLRQIYRKLGVRSRTQLARLLTAPAGVKPQS